MPSVFWINGDWRWNRTGSGFLCLHNGFTGIKLWAFFKRFRLIPEKENLGFLFPCKEPFTGTCQVSGWDHVYLGCCSGCIVVIFHFRWKMQTDEREIRVGSSHPLCKVLRLVEISRLVYCRFWNCQHLPPNLILVWENLFRSSFQTCINVEQGLLLAVKKQWLSISNESCL